MADDSTPRKAGWAAPTSAPTPPSGAATPPPPTPPAPAAPQPPAGGAQRPPSASQPGIIPLRPLSFGQFLDGPVKAIRFNPRAMVMVPAILLFISNGLTALLSYSIFAWLLNYDLYATSYSTPPSIGSIVGTVIGLTIVSILTFFVGVLLVVAVSNSVIGKHTTPGELFRLGRSRFWAISGLGLTLSAIYTIAIIAVSVVVGVLSIIPILGAIVALFIQFAMYVGIAWFMVRVQLSVPALLLEKRGVFDSLRRGWQLSSTRQWYFIGVTVVVGIILNVVATVVSAVPLVLAVGVAIAYPEAFAPTFTTVFGLALFLSTLITTPYYSAVVSLIYVDQRMRLEGFDLQLAEAVEASQG